MIVPEVLKRRKILLINDVTALRNVTKSCLKEVGFLSVVDAREIKLLFNQLKRSPVHLIICEDEVAKVSGLDFLKEIRADSTLSDIPFLMFTADSSVEKVKEAITAGVSGYMIRPFQPAALIKNIVSILEKHPTKATTKT